MTNRDNVHNHWKNKSIRICIYDNTLSNGNIQNNGSFNCISY